MLGAEIRVLEQFGHVILRCELQGVDGLLLPSQTLGSDLVADVLDQSAERLFRDDGLLLQLQVFNGETFQVAFVFELLRGGQTLGLWFERFATFNVYFCSVVWS